VLLDAFLDVGPTSGRAHLREHAFETHAAVGGQLVYAVGDIHGRYDLFKALLSRISADISACAGGRRPVLILCGDYVDRGPDSAQVVDALVWLRRYGALDLHLLMGNHEHMLLAFIANPELMVGWLRQDGVSTLNSYGVQVAKEQNAAGVVKARDELLDAMPASHLELLRSLELVVTLGDYAFVHAGIQPGKALRAQSEEDLLWIKEEFLDHPGPFPKVIVHGHSWIDEKPRLHAQRFGIDTGAYQTGVLTAVRLQDRDVAVIQAYQRPEG
jgi:serine/threonine protein phosphatase 1